MALGTGPISGGPISGDPASGSLSWESSLPLVRYRRRVLDDQPTLPIAPVVVSVAWGWEVSALPPSPRRRPPTIGASEFGVPPTSIYLAWVSADAGPRRVRIAATYLAVSQPAAVAYQSWIVVPELRPLPKPGLSAIVLPVQQVPTQFVGNAWGFMWDGPQYKRFPASAQQDHDLPAQQVPTVFVANGWTAMWDGPPTRKFSPGLQRADQPVLGAYQSAIVVYPDGWQAIFPQLGKITKPQGFADLGARIASAPQGWMVTAEPRFVEHAPGGTATDVTNPPARPIWGWETRVDVQPRRSRAAEASATFIVPALIFRTWGFAEQVQPRARVSGSIVTLVSPVLATPQGFGVTFAEPIRAKFVQRSAEIASFPAVAASPSGFSVVDGLPPRKLRAPASEPLNPVGRFLGTAIGVTALWGFADWHFRVIRPAPPDFGRMWPKIGFRIASQPTLLGTDQRPTIDGTDAQAGLLGTKAQAGLDGTKAAPSLLGTDEEPDLEGDV